jgi:hypothetical protein
VSQCRETASGFVGRHWPGMAPFRVRRNDLYAAHHHSTICMHDRPAHWSVRAMDDGRHRRGGICTRDPHIVRSHRNATRRAREISEPPIPFDGFRSHNPGGGHVHRGAVPLQLARFRAMGSRLGHRGAPCHAPSGNRHSVVGSSRILGSSSVEDHKARSPEGISNFINLSRTIHFRQQPPGHGVGHGRGERVFDRRAAVDAS